MLILIAVGVAMAALLLYLLFRRWQRGRTMDDTEAMEGHDFEYYCADLLTGAGFQDVQVTRGSGDYGADILAEKDGITYAVQCKCYDGPVGVSAVQEVYAGCAYYERMVAAVMTNQYFTGPAVELAGKLHVLLWDRGYLAGMLAEEEN